MTQARENIASRWDHKINSQWKGYKRVDTSNFWDILKISSTQVNLSLFEKELWRIKI